MLEQTQYAAAGENSEYDMWNYWKIHKIIFWSSFFLLFSSFFFFATLPRNKMGKFNASACFHISLQGLTNGSAFLKNSQNSQKYRKYQKFRNYFLRFREEFPSISRISEILNESLNLGPALWPIIFFVRWKQKRNLKQSFFMENRSEAIIFYYFYAMSGKKIMFFFKNAANFMNQN